MAHIEHVQTGFRVVTHVKGRVYRHESGRRKVRTVAQRLQPGVKKRRHVCVLNWTAAEQLEGYGVSQPCFGPACQHAHHTRARIEMLVKAGELRWIGLGQNVAAWVTDKTWKAVPSGPERVKVMQLVNGR